MHTTQVVQVTVLVFSIVVCCVCARNIPDHAVRHRLKRQYGDFRMSQHRAQAGLGKIIPRACKTFACGLVNPHARFKRAASDQRIAELQALIALANGGGSIGHGQFDPFAAGKRKRSEPYFEDDLYDYPIDNHRYRLLERVLETLTHS